MIVNFLVNLKEILHEQGYYNIIYVQLILPLDKHKYDYLEGKMIQEQKVVKLEEFVVANNNKKKLNYCYGILKRIR